jgi:hypothetical protein
MTHMHQPPQEFTHVPEVPHGHDPPVIRERTYPSIEKAAHGLGVMARFIAMVLKLVPVALSTAVGWLIGSFWSVLQFIATASGAVVGTVYLALHTLVFAFYYGFLKGARIPLVKAEDAKRKPSIPR